jgi:RNA polymerase sigma factor for flagellar operon FliA
MPIVHEVVDRIARRLPPNVVREDLIAAGLVGLADSLRRESEGGVWIEAYARMRIRGAIVDELRAQDWLGRRARRAVSRDKERASHEGRDAVFVRIADLDGFEALALEQIAANDDPVEVLEARAVLRVVADALDRLPERERRVLVLHYFEGARMREIGEAMGISEPRVSQLHTQALARLRQLIAA